MALVELALTVPNRPGTLAGVARLLAQHKIDLAAISVDSTGKRGHVRIVPSNPDRAESILEEAGYAVERTQLLPVHLEDRTGSLLPVLERLASRKINVRNLTILVRREGARVVAALGFDDPEKARALLEKEGYAVRDADRLLSNSDLVAAAPAIPGASVGLLL